MHQQKSGGLSEQVNPVQSVELGGIGRNRQEMAGGRADQAWGEFNGGNPH